MSNVQLIKCKVQLIMVNFNWNIDLIFLFEYVQFCASVVKYVGFGNKIFVKVLYSH